MIKTKYKFNIVEPKDIRNIIEKEKPIDSFVYDKEYNRYDYITNIYIDKEGSLIIEIGGEA